MFISLNDIEKNTLSTSIKILCFTNIRHELSVRSRMNLVSEIDKLNLILYLPQI